jgi:hypothetical protein
VAVSIATCVLVSFAMTSTASESYSTAMVYSAEIEKARRVGDTDRRPELQRCLARVNVARNAALWRETIDRGALRSSTYVLIEVATAGWDTYSRSAMWVDDRAIGHLVTDMATGRTGQEIEREFPGRELRDLVETLRVPDTPIVGVINSNVDDGPCYFVTIRDGKRVERFAAYAPRAGSRASERSELTLGELARFVDRRANSQP